MAKGFKRDQREAGKKGSVSYSGGMKGTKSTTFSGPLKPSGKSAKYTGGKAGK